MRGRELRGSRPSSTTMSTLTKTALANIALGHIGKAPISDIDERSPEAQTVKQHWDLARDELLRQKAWKFATKRATLAALSATPEFEWAYAWQLPSDYIRAIEFNGRQAGTGEAGFDVEGTSLLTNDACAKLKYVARIEQVSAWDAGFCAAFALLLAAAVAPSISSAQGLGANLRQRGEMAAMQAFGPDNHEARARAVLATSGSGYLAARYDGMAAAAHASRSSCAPASSAVSLPAGAVVLESINENGLGTFRALGQRFELPLSDLRLA